MAPIGRGPDGGPVLPIKVRPEDFHKVAKDFTDSSSAETGVYKISSDLFKGIAPSTGWAGVDDHAIEFGRKFSEAYGVLLTGFDRAAQVLGDIGYGIDLSARNHWLADAAATPGGPTEPPWTPVSPPLILPTDAAPFQLSGNATLGLAEPLRGKVPMGDPQKLYAAAQAFAGARDAIDDTTNRLHQSLKSLFTNNQADDLHALEEFWGRVGGSSNAAILTALREGCDQLGRAVSDFGAWINDTQNEIINAIGSILGDILEGIALGALLALLSAGIGGLSEIFAAANAVGKAGELVIAIDGALTAANAVGRAAAVGGAVGGVIGMMNVAINSTPSPSLEPTNPQQTTDAKVAKDAENLGDKGGTFPEPKYPRKQLERKFDSHASDFGVQSPRGSQGFKEFEQKLRDFVNDEATVKRVGTYHREPAILAYNPKTGLCEILRPDGTFWTGWKLNPEQLKNIIERGSL